MSTGLQRECERLRERLPEHAEGKLGGRLRARLERHLARCERCSAELADLRTVIHAVRAVGEDPVPEDLLPNLRRTLAAQGPSPSPAPQFWARIAVPVAVATGLVAVAFAFHVTRPPQARLAPEPSAGITAGARQEVAARDRIEQEPVVLGRLGTERGEAPAPAAAGREWERTAGEPEPDTRPPRKLRGEERALSWPEPTPPISGPTDQPAELAKERRLEGQMRRDGRLEGARGGAPHAAPSDTLETTAYALTRDESALREGKAVEGAAEAEQPAPPPVSARAVLTRRGSSLAIGLAVSSTAPALENQVYAGGPAGRQLLWSGRAGTAQTVVLPSEQIGPGPAAIPVWIESAAGGRHYVLFVPLLSRLGETAESAPRASYVGEPLSQVLADLSALTGLVLLAETPLDRKVVGELPGGSPGDVLEHIADSADMTLAREGEIANTLTRR
jgi:hypothetical protein